MAIYDSIISCRVVLDVIDCSQFLKTYTQSIRTFSPVVSKSMITVRSVRFVANFYLMCCNLTCLNKPNKLYEKRFSALPYPMSNLHPIISGHRRESGDGKPFALGTTPDAVKNCRSVNGNLWDSVRRKFPSQHDDPSIGHCMGGSCLYIERME